MVEIRRKIWNSLSLKIDAVENKRRPYVRKESLKPVQKQIDSSSRTPLKIASEILKKDKFAAWHVLAQFGHPNIALEDLLTGTFTGHAKTPPFV